MQLSLGVRQHPDHEAPLPTESQPIAVHLAAGRFAPLVGLSVSHHWLSHGAALFLELGPLILNERGRRQGAATVMLDCDWVLGGTGLGLVDRDTPNGIMTAELRRLKNQRVSSLELSAADLSLNLGVERGQWVHAGGRDTAESSWTVFLPDNGWITVEHGELVLQRGSESAHDRAV